MAKYFIYGYYGFGNFGDDLLLNSLISGIRLRDANASFTIRAREPITSIASDPSINFLLSELILENKSKNKAFRFLSYLFVLSREACRCDYFVIGGGTLFIDKGFFNWSILFIYGAALSAKLAKKRVIICGVAIDILANPAVLWLTRRVFALANYSAVRDALSLAYFQDWSKQPKLSADLAWLCAFPKLDRRQSQRVRIGLNFIDYFRTSTKSDQRHEAYRSALQQLIKRHHSNCDFHIISLQKGIGLKDDWYFHEFKTLVPDGQIYYVDDMPQLKSALEVTDAVITTRFHLALLAAKCGVRTCVIDHELKLTSLAQELTLPSISMTEFISDRGLDPIKRLQGWNADIVSKASADLEERAQLNFGWINA